MQAIAMTLLSEDEEIQGRCPVALEFRTPAGSA
jgi:hypothetical protein